MDYSENLMSTQKSLNSGLHVILHPLPVLEISDHIARNYIRGNKQAIVGAALGQQKGRETTVEHTFTCKTLQQPSGLYELDKDWFAKRLEETRLIYKNPVLDLVGWYALVPKSGPCLAHVPIHRQILQHNESALLIGFHWEEVLRPAAGDPLPLTVYESNMEVEDGATPSAGGEVEDEDKEMKDPDAISKLILRFQELPCTTESGEAEMIAMEWVKEGGAAATTQAGDAGMTQQKADNQPRHRPSAGDDSRGKQRALAFEEEPSKSKSMDTNLNKSELETMSALQAKHSAIKMMHSKLKLFIAYLEQLPPDFVTGKRTAAATTEASDGHYLPPSLKILRQIQALVTNAELASPEKQAALEKEMRQETNDVNLIALLSDILCSVNDVRETGKTYAVVQLANRSAKLRQTQLESEAGGKMQSVGAAGELF